MPGTQGDIIYLSWLYTSNEDSLVLFRCESPTPPDRGRGNINIIFAKCVDKMMEQFKNIKVTNIMKPESENIICYDH